MAVVFPFGEGSTDRLVFNFLKSKLFPDEPLRQFVAVNGKNNFRSQVQRTIEADILPNNTVTVIVFRDLDAGESGATVAKSFRDLVWSLLAEWNLQPDIQPHNLYPNLYQCTQSSSATTPGLRLDLHLANNSTLGLPVEILNQTTDGYLLAAGLTDGVLERFASKAQTNARALQLLVTAAIPGSIRQTDCFFDQDKDYLAAYLCATRFWVHHRTEDQARLVSIILERSWRYDQNTFQQLFASWRTAVEEALQ